ncbi:cupin domain-containing protein [Paracoccus sp. p4-l81]|uniref:cupin domain-containing protein n=1 Tax=Paracoccus sp. p4-l81 TaxID=3342806 RepID=UPI0035BAF66E
MHLIEVAPGDATTEHHGHYHEDQCVYVLAREATLCLDEEAHAIGPGDFIAHPKDGAAHSIFNTGAEVLRCLVIGWPMMSRTIPARTSASSATPGCPGCWSIWIRPRSSAERWGRRDAPGTRRDRG